MATDRYVRTAPNVPFVLSDHAGGSVMKQDDEIAEAAARLTKIRKLCDDLDKALENSADQRALLAQMKRDAEEAYRALTRKT